ncbi:DMT family transporter [Candidatus Uhrbacteria bacterium]|nr:DMT family transporter [Candidatus Uhrbacteria bacterium]
MPTLLDWFPYSLIATLSFGVAMAMYKFPAAKQLDRYAATFWSLAASTCIALVVFSSAIPRIAWNMNGIAALWGISFTGIMLLQMYALHHMETNVLFPTTTTSSLVLTVLIGLLAFQDPITMLQSGGIIIVVIAVAAFLFRGGRLAYAPHILVVGIGIIALSVFNKLLQKIAADRYDVRAYQIVQYAYAAGVALLVLIMAHRTRWHTALFGRGAGIGVLIGAVSFAGGAAFFTALTRGPFTLITTIHSLYTFATAITAWLLFRERLTKRRLVLIALAALGAILIRIG